LGDDIWAQVELARCSLISEKSVLGKINETYWLSLERGCCLSNLAALWIDSELRILVVDDLKNIKPRVAPHTYKSSTGPLWSSPVSKATLTYCVMSARPWHLGELKSGPSGARQIEPNIRKEAVFGEENISLPEPGPEESSPGSAEN
jgi:hypothetical protein